MEGPHAVSWLIKDWLIKWKKGLNSVWTQTATLGWNFSLPGLPEKIVCFKLTLFHESNAWHGFTSVHMQWSFRIHGGCCLQQNGMKLGNVMRNEISQSRKEKYQMFSLICGTYNTKYKNVFYVSEMTFQGLITCRIWLYSWGILNSGLPVC